MIILREDGNVDGNKNSKKNNDGQHDNRKTWWWWIAALILFLYFLFFVCEERTWKIHPDVLEKEADAAPSADEVKLVHNEGGINNSIVKNVTSPIDSAHVNDTTDATNSGMPKAENEVGALSNSSVQTATSTPGQSPEVPTPSAQESTSTSSSAIPTANPTAPTVAKDQLVEHDAKNEVDDPEALYEVPFVVFGSLQYRRVCSPIGSSSVVCMTIRFPWADGVSLQDETVSYPKPVDERFYLLDKKQAMVIIDGDLLEQCKTMTNDTGDETDEKADTLSPLDDLVKRCLDMVASTKSVPSVVVVFYREQRHQEETNITGNDTQKNSNYNNGHAADVENENDPSKLLFGTGRGKQLSNVLDFFDGQVVQVFGDSTAPGVTSCMRGLFGGACTGSPVERKVASFYCAGKKTTNNGRRTANTVARTAAATENDDGNNNKRYLRNKKNDVMELVNDSDEFPSTNRSLAWTDMDESYNIFLGMDGYYPPAREKFVAHKLPQHNLVDWIVQLGMKRNPGWTELRDLTIIIQYPFAHTQTQLMIYNEWDNIVETHTKFPEMILAVQSAEGRNTLESLGWNLKHLIVSDGFPQYFPTDSSAVFGSRLGLTEEKFLERNGYPVIGDAPGWRPELGSKCRGPVPVTSNMTKVHMMSRTSFERLGFDMQFYIPNWEFSNQFWWETKGWDSKGLDCTHAGGSYYCIHMYLLQAMIDDYYENKQ